jgi:chromosomal replication initiation ATPase DnaA
MIKIKSIIDDLALINNRFSDEELITHTFNGLEDEFKKLTTTIRVHDSTIIF